MISVNYTANVISHLTVSRPEIPITSLEEFASRQDWTFAMEYGLGALGDWAVRSSSGPQGRTIGEEIEWGLQLVRLNYIGVVN